jgi:hypothetical protein
MAVILVTLGCWEDTEDADHLGVSHKAFLGDSVVGEVILVIGIHRLTPNLPEAHDHLIVIPSLSRNLPPQRCSHSRGHTEEQYDASAALREIPRCTRDDS